MPATSISCQSPELGIFCPFFTAIYTTREHMEGLQGQFPDEGPRDALHKPYNQETLCLASPALALSDGILFFKLKHLVSKFLSVVYPQNRLCVIRVSPDPGLCASDSYLGQPQPRRQLHSVSCHTGHRGSSE